MKDLVKKVSEIQSKLKAPKGQFNKFGNYAYRNQEDILEAVKPLLGDLVLTIGDEIVAVQGTNRIYVKSTATITNGTDSISNVAYAREAEAAKGMSESQLTGSASSYSRKYALNGLFLIDDTKDDDATNTHGKDNTPESKKELVKPVIKTEVKTIADPLADKKTDTSPATEAPKKRFGGFASKAKPTGEVS